jgi:hypothetical protein
MNHLKFIQKMSEQRTGKARNQRLQKQAIPGTVHIMREVQM